MTPTKIDFYTVDKNGNHSYEFSSNIELNTFKPLTKIIIAKSYQIGVPPENIEIHNRNRVRYSKPFNGKNKSGARVFKQKDVVQFYCNKSKKEK